MHSDKMQQACYCDLAVLQGKGLAASINRTSVGESGSATLM
jgi:hypothetical protein